MATRKRERIFALSLALLFFITSFGFSFFVIWEQHQNSNSNSSNNAANQQVINNLEANLQNNQTNNTPQQPKLAGTKLSNFTPVADVPQLVTTDSTVGTGTAATPSSTVTVQYTGAVAATGVIFQSSYDSGQPATLGLNQVIKGWMEGIPGMKVGGTRRLLIPAADAYGASPPQGAGIPANAALVFDVTLLAVK